MVDKPKLEGQCPTGQAGIVLCAVVQFFAVGGAEGLDLRIVFPAPTGFVLTPKDVFVFKHPETQKPDSPFIYQAEGFGRKRIAAENAMHPFSRLVPCASRENVRRIGTDRVRNEPFAPLRIAVEGLNAVSNATNHCGRSSMVMVRNPHFVKRLSVGYQRPTGQNEHEYVGPLGVRNRVSGRFGSSSTYGSGIGRLFCERERFLHFTGLSLAGTFGFARQIDSAVPKLFGEMSQSPCNRDQHHRPDYKPPLWILKKVVVPAALLIGGGELQLAGYGRIDRSANRRDLYGYGLVLLGLICSFLGPYIFFFG